MSIFSKGPRNLITDVAGLKVGNAQDHHIKTGTTVLVFDEPAAASCHVMGGAPGTRDTELLEPHQTVEAVDALFLSGGSAFGLEAGGGVMAGLKAKGRGFAVGDQRVPIAPGAILFDLINGGNKDWGDEPPYRALGRAALERADLDFEVGSVGAGTGALVAGLKGGLGSASTVLPDGSLSGGMVGALVAVNALGSPCMGKRGAFHARAFEIEDEFGAVDPPSPLPANADEINIKFRERAAPGTSTTIGIIATDIALTKAELKRLAIAAHDGFARALWPAHTPLDGDLVFAASTARRSKPGSMDAWIDLCAVASATMARAIARGIYNASAAENDIMPTWRSRFAQ